MFVYLYGVNNYIIVKIADENPDPSPTPEEVQDIAEDTENISLRLVMEDDTSDSLSPPVLLPLQEVNSDFEENIEDPPDLDMYQLNHGSHFYYCT